jgi:hypothetical protein
MIPAPVSEQVQNLPLKRLTPITAKINKMKIPIVMMLLMAEIEEKKAFTTFLS